MRLDEVLDTIVEGPNDPHIFKAVFMLGGPGSGKSTVAKKLFSGSGLKPVNSDIILEYLMKKKDISFDFTRGNPDEDRQRAARQVAADKHLDQLDSYIDGRLGLVIDGTGKVFRRINMMRKRLEDLGYDTAAIYVHIDDKVAQQRNKERARSVDSQVVSDIHAAVKQNLGAYEYTFGQDFYTVDNDTRENLEQSLQIVEKGIRNWLSKPPTKSEAKKWLEQQRK